MTKTKLIKLFDSGMRLMQNEYTEEMYFEAPEAKSFKEAVDDAKILLPEVAKVFKYKGDQVKLKRNLGWGEMDVSVLSKDVVLLEDIGFTRERWIELAGLSEHGNIQEILKEAEDASFSKIMDRLPGSGKPYR